MPPNLSINRVNFMDPTILGSIAALVAASLALVGLGATAIYRVGKLSQNTEDLRREIQSESRHIRELMDERFNQAQELIRSENSQTRAQIQQLSTIVMSHSHDTDGNIIFRVPPPTQEE